MPALSPDTSTGQPSRRAVTLDARATPVTFEPSTILPALAPESGDEVLYKTRFSGFYKTDLDARLARRGIRHLIVTGCTTSICVESTVRDAMFRDYLSVLLADCMSEPIGGQLPRTNHEASLLSTEVLLGWTSTSEAFVRAVSA